MIDDDGDDDYQGGDGGAISFIVTDRHGGKVHDGYTKRDTGVCFNKMASAATKAAKHTVKHSGLQKEVLSLNIGKYKEALKKEPSVSAGIIDLARRNFKEKATSIRKTDYQTIEHSIRDARKK